VALQHFAPERDVLVDRFQARDFFAGALGLRNNAHLHAERTPRAERAALSQKPERDRPRSVKPYLIELQAESPKVFPQQRERVRAEFALNILAGRIASGFLKSSRERIAPPRVVLEEETLCLSQGAPVGLGKRIIVFR